MTQFVQDIHACLKWSLEAKWDNLGTSNALDTYLCATELNPKPLLIKMGAQTSNSQVDTYIQIPKFRNLYLWIFLLWLPWGNEWGDTFHLKSSVWTSSSSYLKNKLMSCSTLYLLLKSFSLQKKLREILLSVLNLSLTRLVFTDMLIERCKNM